MSSNKIPEPGEHDPDNIIRLDMDKIMVDELKMLEERIA